VGFTSASQSGHTGHFPSFILTPVIGHRDDKADMGNVFLVPLRDGEVGCRLRGVMRGARRSRSSGGSSKSSHTARPPRLGCVLIAMTTSPIVRCTRPISPRRVSVCSWRATAWTPSISPKSCSRTWSWWISHYPLLTDGRRRAVWSTTRARLTSRFSRVRGMPPTLPLTGRSMPDVTPTSRTRRHLHPTTNPGCVECSLSHRSWDVGPAHHQERLSHRSWDVGPSHRGWGRPDQGEADPLLADRRGW